MVIMCEGRVELGNYRLAIISRIKVAGFLADQTPTASDEDLSGLLNSREGKIYCKQFRARARKVCLLGPNDVH